MDIMIVYHVSTVQYSVNVLYTTQTSLESSSVFGLSDITNSMRPPLLLPDMSEGNPSWARTRFVTSVFNDSLHAVLPVGPKKSCCKSAFG